MNIDQSRLLEVGEARDRLLANHQPVGAEKIDIEHALGRIIASDIYAPFDFPSFSNSAMDGFAIRSVDLERASASEPVVLQVIADIPAGSTIGPTINAGQAARIMTGAMLPEGADSVVPIEDTDAYRSILKDELPPFVRIFRALKSGDYIRPVGQDVRKGQLLLSQGQVLGPAQVGLCAQFGFSELEVWKKPKVAIISSGNEVIAPGEKLAPGKVYDANSRMLVGLVQKCGGVPYQLGIVPDNRQAIQSILKNAASIEVDLIISSAGVSVGAFDYMKQVIEDNGQIDFWRVNMRPGKPIVSGNYQKIPYLGLPGNPVSAFVGFVVFIEPLIKKMSGEVAFLRREITIKLLDDVQSDGRQSYLRAFVYEEQGILYGRLIGHQGSGDIYSLGRANTLLIIPSGVKSVRSGEEVQGWPLDDFIR